MRQSEAELRAQERYGLLKGARLVHYASLIYVLGEHEFDRQASRPQRYKVLKELGEVGIRFDEIEWRGYLQAMQRSTAKVHAANERIQRRYGGRRRRPA